MTERPIYWWSWDDEDQEFVPVCVTWKENGEIGYWTYFGSEILCGTEKDDWPLTLVMPLSQHLQQWQPIETAPKDGTDILAWSPEIQSCLVIHWSGIETIYAADAGYWTDGEGRGHDATHWMPLPNPPEAQS